MPIIRILKKLRGEEEMRSEAEVHEAFKNSDVLIRTILKNPEGFKRLVTDNYDLRETAKVSPQNAADALIGVVLKNPDEFKRLITDSYFLPTFAQAFPQHAEIFGKPSVSEAEEAVRLLHALKKTSHAEIRKNSRLIAQGNRSSVDNQFSFFSALPPEIGVKIAALTGNSRVHNKEKAGEIAREHYSRPSN
jgi:hypothetical protein